MDIILIAVVFSALVGYWANNWGRNGWLWFVVALLISPLISAIILLVMGRDKEAGIELEAQRLAAVEKRKSELMDK